MAEQPPRVIPFRPRVKPTDAPQQRPCFTDERADEAEALLATLARDMAGVSMDVGVSVVALLAADIITQLVGPALRQHYLRTEFVSIVEQYFTEVDRHV